MRLLAIICFAVMVAIASATALPFELEDATIDSALIDSTSFNRTLESLNATGSTNERLNACGYLFLEGTNGKQFLQQHWIKKDPKMCYYFPEGTEITYIRLQPFTHCEMWLYTNNQCFSKWDLLMHKKQPYQGSEMKGKGVRWYRAREDPYWGHNHYDPPRA